MEGRERAAAEKMDGGVPAAGSALPAPASGATLEEKIDAGAPTVEDGAPVAAPAAEEVIGAGTDGRLPAGREPALALAKIEGVAGCASSPVGGDDARAAVAAPATDRSPTDSSIVLSTAAGARAGSEGAIIGAVPTSTDDGRTSVSDISISARSMGCVESPTRNVAEVCAATSTEVKPPRSESESSSVMSRAGRATRAPAP
jgi:hypothetical protein